MARRYMSEREFNKRLKQIQRENESLRRMNKLEEERSRLRPKKKKLTTSKLALLIMFLIVFEIVIFTEYLMYITHDLSALYVLIGIPATMVVTLWRYFAKAQAENTQFGITYETAMKENQPEPISDDYIEDVGSTSYDSDEEDLYTQDDIDIQDECDESGELI